MRVIRHYTISGNQWRLERMLEINLTSIVDGLITALVFFSIWLVTGIVLVTSPVWVPVCYWFAWVDSLLSRLEHEEFTGFNDHFFYSLDLPDTYHPIMITPDITKLTKEHREKLIKGFRGRPSYITEFYFPTQGNDCSIGFSGRRVPRMKNPPKCPGSPADIIIKIRGIKSDYIIVDDLDSTTKTNKIMKSIPVFICHNKVDFIAKDHVFTDQEEAEDFCLTHAYYDYTTGVMSVANEESPNEVSWASEAGLCKTKEQMELIEQQAFNNGRLEAKREHDLQTIEGLRMIISESEPHSCILKSRLLKFITETETELAKS